MPSPKSLTTSCPPKKIPETLPPRNAKQHKAKAKASLVRVKRQLSQLCCGKCRSAIRKEILFSSCFIVRLWDAIGKTKEADTPCPIYVVAGLGTGLARPPARLCRLAAPRVQAVYGMAAAVCMYCFSSSTFLCCVWM